MTLKTCLLITDDPDDHQAFSEAVSELSEDTVVLIVLDSQKALDLLKSKTHLPDYIFLDLSMHGVRINSFSNILRGDADLHGIPTITYGEVQEFDKIQNNEGLFFFNKEYEYTDLQQFLTRLFNQDKN
jgi:CheY-like chemotaxis protein